MDIRRYSTIAIIIHWLMAILLICMFALGIYMVDLPKGSDERSWFFALHKSIGLTLALLALMRLFLKFIFKAPPLPDDVTFIQKKLATATHNLLYLMMFIQPITGYISSSFSGYKTKFWGVPLPHWGWKSPDLNELFTRLVNDNQIILEEVPRHGVRLHELWATSPHTQDLKNLI